jgi:hypothetical protein
MMPGSFHPSAHGGSPRTGHCYVAGVDSDSIIAPEAPFGLYFSLFGAWDAQGETY